jgi:hypothetical protein
MPLTVLSSSDNCNLYVRGALLRRIKTQPTILTSILDKPKAEGGEMGRRCGFQTPVLLTFEIFQEFYIKGRRITTGVAAGIEGNA